ncbi:MAG TPA: PLDc N-terminal domain-containing protein, partial [Humisphaera sp.]
MITGAHWATAYLISEWLVRLAMLLYVPQRRPPAAARTWLLILFLLPWPGLVLYWAFGRVQLPRRRRAMHSRAVATIRAARGR